MSGIGFWELIILFLIGLIVLGPERLPRVANQLGSWLGQARRMTRMMKRQLEEEIDLDLNKEFGVGPGIATNPKPDVSKPTYVHDRNARQDGGEDGEPERPDDYSPAHEPGAAGTGVGDDRDYIDDDELEPVSAEPTGAGETTAETAAEDPAEKKQTA